MAIRTNVYERTVDPRGIPRASFLLFSAGLALGAACESFPYARLSAKDLLCSHQWNSDRRTVESNVKAGQWQSAPVIPEQTSGWLRWLSGCLDCLCSFSLGFWNIDRLGLVLISWEYQ